MATNKEIVAKGLLYLAGSLPLLALGPIVLNSAFKNEKHPLYPYVVGFGIILCFFAVFLIFKGINTLLKSIFNNKN